MSVKDKFYQQLISTFASEPNGFTAAQCLSLLSVKRNVISHYLNRLCEDGMLTKDSSRPVRFYLSGVQTPAAVLPQAENESLYRQMALCRAAVDYPPDGLALLLTGESGTGKSYLASRLYDYACQQGLIAVGRPLVELNCADYANNPELLSSTLFGHSKGAFTGAAGEKAGLLDNANGGMLFLDEVHRLSAENQEKLFLFMDKGYFYRLGDNKHPRSAQVRFVFATTEEVGNVLLRTLRRRIPITVHLPAWHERTRRERIALLETFLRQEAKQLHCDIRLDSTHFYGWLNGRFAGNIGEIRNQIKVMCATAWIARQENTPLHLGGVTAQRDAQYHGWLIHQDARHNELPRDDALSAAFADYVVSLDATRFLDETQAWLAEHEPENKHPPHSLLQQIVGAALENLSQRWGIPLPPALQLALCVILREATGGQADPRSHYPTPALCSYPPRARLMAQEFIDAVAVCGELASPDMMFTLSAALFALHDNPQAKLQGIIVTHGQSTASSIASLVNQLTGGYYFTAFDMPWLTSTQTIIEMLINHLTLLRNDSGILILVDMGSLKEIWHGIHQHVHGDLVVINNVTTLLALDIAEKLQQGLPMPDIISAIPGRYENEIRYYAGVPARNTLIVACISGEGIARKLQDILAHALAAVNIDVITMEYDALRRALKEKGALADTRLIITTTDLDTGGIPSLTIRNIIQGNTDSLLQNYFAEWLDDAEFVDMIQQMVELFTLEGISSRLTFLNPRVVLEDIETLIRRYEQDYHCRFENYLHINLVMHIALMTERLMLNSGHTHRDDETLDACQQRFISQHTRYFQPLVQKYRITIPLTELLMIDEILAGVRSRSTHTAHGVENDA
ncbi:sigma 54-interacting transcriptional regulator [[Enterobacter] lignolyticus]|uniref:Sigma 54 interacting domain protein n=1 Tax=Enterobacter lignolyticus (strain SCF1) TaxID=701347 RepID=E3G1I0_ENTLS|nr:sigma 54-interacting transcriptional regulator [[Enterobacter] lignolyticus]ADO50265.1 Sigma 54 interacting domain protein [[Enterobacter] lignolyticus SCF1]